MGIHQTFLSEGCASLTGDRSELHSSKAAHIVICFHDFSAGGTERIALTLASEWVRQGRKVTILCGVNEGVLRDRVASGVRVKELAPPIRRSPVSRLVLGRKMAAAMAGLKPDVVFLPGNFHFIIAQALKRAMPGVPIVAKVSNPLLPPLPRPLAGMARLALSRYVGPIDHLVYMAGELAEEGQKYLPQSAASVISEPILPRGFATPARKPADDGPLIVAIGRLEPQKNLSLALHSFAELLARRPARMLILGEGAERPQLVALARKLGIAPHLSMPGYVKNPQHMLSQASALLLTSRFEGYPAVVVEALAADVPVVATDCSISLHHLLSSETHGTIVEKPSPSALADGLIKAMGLPFSSGGLRPASVAHIDAGASSAAYLALFDQLVSAQSGRH